MPNRTVLIAGESWIMHTIHQKGWGVQSADRRANVSKWLAINSHYQEEPLSAARSSIARAN